MNSKKRQQAAASLFQRLLPIVQKVDREQRVARMEMSENQVRAVSDADLAARLRVKRARSTT